jgi:hypothetical protein
MSERCRSTELGPTNGTNLSRFPSRSLCVKQRRINGLDLIFHGVLSVPNQVLYPTEPLPEFAWALEELGMRPNTINRL